MYVYIFKVNYIGAFAYFSKTILLKSFRCLIWLALVISKLCLVLQLLHSSHQRNLMCLCRVWRQCERARVWLRHAIELMPFGFSLIQSSLRSHQSRRMRKHCQFISFAAININFRLCRARVKHSRCSHSPFSPLSLMS